MNKSISTIFTVLMLFLGQRVFAQSAGQLVISGYDKTQPFYLCNGVGQTTGQNIIFAILNTNQGVDIIIDSFEYRCDHTVFDVSGIDTMKDFDAGGVSTLVAYYTPKKEESDTLFITAFYDGFSSSGRIICHAVDAPPISFYGVEIVPQDLGFGIKLGVSDEVLTVDTLHDKFMNLTVSDTPIVLRHYNYNTQIVVRACGERTIDQIYRVGDSSEVLISGIPQLPYTMHSGGALVMPFELTPKIPGNTPHYFVLHTTDDDYLVWSFEYHVLGDNSVHSFNSPAESLDAVIYPNPINNGVTNLQIVSSKQANVHLHLLGLQGRFERELGSYGIAMGASTIRLGNLNLASGTYVLLIDSDNGSIDRKLDISW